MIYSSENNVGVILNTKTGTTSLTMLCRNVPSIDHNEHDHRFYTINGRDQSSFQYYSIYRDPVERARSTLSYLRRNFYTDYIQKLVYPTPELPCTHTCRYDELTQDNKDIIESIPQIDLIQYCVDNLTRPSVYGLNFMTPQCKIFKQVDKLHLLHFNDFDNSINTIMKALGAENYVIPKHNVSLKNSERDFLDDECISLIKEYFKEDYEYFESRGITFNN